MFKLLLGNLNVTTGFLCGQPAKNDSLFNVLKLTFFAAVAYAAEFSLSLAFALCVFYTKQTAAVFSVLKKHRMGAG